MLTNSGGSGQPVNPMQVQTFSCTLYSAGLTYVLGEDYTNNSWNDLVVIFSWWVTPNP
jgi:hypothetical protein